MNFNNNGTKILALIPARGGSKRLPKKNLLSLAGKPLLTWTIESLRPYFSSQDILVSTDSEEIAAVAIANGASVPWLRPDYLSTDTASSIDVAIHALDWYESEYGEVDGLLLLQPTSPFRPIEAVSDVVRQFLMSNCEPVVSVSPSSAHPLWVFKLNQGLLQPYINSNGLTTRSQDLPDAYCLNGSLYLAAPKCLREHRTFLIPSTSAYVMDNPVHGIDIDTPFDFKVAELIAAHQ
jgi:CMP-N-acetylneuraminic acid synthetase